MHDPGCNWRPEFIFCHAYNTFPRFCVGPVCRPSHASYLPSNSYVIPTRPLRRDHICKLSSTLTPVGVYSFFSNRLIDAALNGCVVAWRLRLLNNPASTWRLVPSLGRRLIVARRYLWVCEQNTKTRRVVSRRVPQINRPIQIADRKHYGVSGWLSAGKWGGDLQRFGPVPIAIARAIDSGINYIELTFQYSGCWSLCLQSRSQGIQT